MRTRIITLLTVFAACGTYVSAQDYDDDIYYNPDKAKKNTSVSTTKPAVEKPRVYTTSEQYTYPASSYTVAPADSFTPPATSTMDVDAYNRRGIFATGDNAGAQAQQATDDFANTRSIERFYNPDVISESNDADLAAMYYSEPSNVTININTPDYWGYPYYGYYGGYYPRSWWYYNNWYYNSWAWNFGPSWSWSWGPSWSWGWSRPYYRPYYYHHYRPTWANRPHGNYRPGYRPSRGYRYGYSHSGTGNYRPGRGSYGGYRWGGTGNSRRDNVSGSNRGHYRNSGSSSGSGSYRPGRNSGSSSGSSYRHSGGSSYRQSGGSYSGGSRGSFGGSRGSSRGGGTGRGRH